MKSRDRIVIVLAIIFFFVVGLVIFLQGVKNGQNIAVQLTKPSGATAWSTSQTQMDLVSYGVCMFGGLWILMAHILLVLFIAKNHIFKGEGNP